MGHIAIIATLVTAWLSTVASGAFGADPRTLTNRPESQGFTSQAPELQTLRVRVNKGLLSLQAIHWPYIEVLDALQKETGIRFHYSIPMAETVTLAFKDVPVQEALKRLLGREAQLMFRFPEGPSIAGRVRVPEDVWILGKVSGPIPEAGGPADESAALVRKDGTSALADESQLDAEPETSELWEVDSLVETMQSDDPSLRLEAISALAGSGQADQEAVKAVLHAALNDMDAGVRAQAVQALVLRGGAEASGYLDQAMRDQDPSVRMMALESVVPAEHGVDLLKQALSDSDPTVRAIAEARLHPDEVRGRPE